VTCLQCFAASTSFAQCAKKARLTRVAFNPRYPILLVGDSKGNVSAYKLSPNLRKNVKVDDKSGAKVEDLERQKLEQVTAVAKRSQAPAVSALGVAS
jgi:dynein intermediate chain 1